MNYVGNRHQQVVMNALTSSVDVSLVRTDGVTEFAVEFLLIGRGQ